MYIRVKKLNQLPITEISHKPSITCIAILIAQNIEEGCIMSMKMEGEKNVKLKQVEVVCTVLRTLTNFFRSLPEAIVRKVSYALLISRLSASVMLRNNFSGSIASGSVGGVLNAMGENCLLN